MPRIKSKAIRNAANVQLHQAHKRHSYLKVFVPVVGDPPEVGLLLLVKDGPRVPELGQAFVRVQNVEKEVNHLKSSATQAHDEAKQLSSYHVKEVYRPWYCRRKFESWQLNLTWDKELARVVLYST